MAKKMILMDPRGLPSVTPAIPDSVGDLVRRLDGDMDGILRDPTLQLSEKMTRYNEVLRDYLSKADEYRTRQRLPMESLTSMERSLKSIDSRGGVVNNNVAGVGDVGGDGAAGFAAGIGGVRPVDKAEIAQITELISPRLRNKASRLLSFVKSVPGVTWTDRGELKVGNQTVPGSHIVDLLSHSVKPVRGVGSSRSNPLGWARFSEVLRSANVPYDLVRVDFSASVPELQSDYAVGVVSPKSVSKKRRVGSSVVKNLRWSQLQRGRRL